MATSISALASLSQTAQSRRQEQQQKPASQNADPLVVAARHLPAQASSGTATPLAATQPAANLLAQAPASQAAANSNSAQAAAAHQNQAQSATQARPNQPNSYSSIDIRA